MKVLLYGPSTTDNQAACINARLSEYAESNAIILVGEVTQAEDLGIRHLADMEYPSVILYSTAERTAPLDDGWAVRRVEHARRHRWFFRYESFNCGRATIEAMAADADRGLVLWDGSALDAFGAILYMVALGKHVDVIHANGEMEEVRSFGDLRNMLPARSRQHRPWDANIPLRDQRMVAELFISSKSIAERLAMVPFRKRVIIGIILGSPTPLDKKLDVLTVLSKYDDLMHEIVDEVEGWLGDARGNGTSEDRLRSVYFGWSFAAYNSFSTHRDAVRDALEVLRSTGTGEIIYRKSFWDERPELFEEHEAGIAPFSNIDAALEDLRFEMVRDEWDDDAPFWSTFEKWRLAPDGTWENPFTYYAIKDEIVFFDRNVYDEENHFWAREEIAYGGSIAPDLNIRVPFGVGDVVTLDCRPFAPLRHALVIEAEDEGHAECCMPRVLHLDDCESKRRGEPIWTETGPKHASSLHLCMPGYSPLYRMELYEGTLPEDEQLIGEVRDWLRGDAERGRQLSEALMCEMSSEEILTFISEH